MRKILFALACIATLTLGSCFEEPGSYSEFWQYVLVDTTSTPISLKGFYMGEEYSGFSNLRYPEQLATFNIDDTPLAGVKIRIDVDASYKQTLTLLSGYSLNVGAITNVTPTDSLQPLLSLLPLIDYTYYTPTLWVREGYLNMAPITPSSQTGNYYLMPEKVSNDTLFFKLGATYKENKDGSSYKSLFYDLRTLRDTTKADPELRAKMREAAVAIDQHSNDSMYIVLTYEEIIYNFNHLGKDTIVTVRDITNCFSCDF